MAKVEARKSGISLKRRGAILASSIILLVSVLFSSCNLSSDGSAKSSSQRNQAGNDAVAKQNYELGLKLSRQNKTIYLPPGHPLLDREKNINQQLSLARSWKPTQAVPFSPELPASFAELSEQEKEIVLNLDPTVGRVGTLLTHHFTKLAAKCKEPSFANLAGSLRGVSTMVEEINDPEAFLTNPLTGKPYQLTSPEKIPGNIYIKLLAREELEEFLQENPKLHIKTDPTPPRSWLFVRIWGPERVIYEMILSEATAGPCATYPTPAGE